MVCATPSLRKCDDARNERQFCIVDWITTLTNLKFPKEMTMNTASIDVPLDIGDIMIIAIFEENMACLEN